MIKSYIRKIINSFGYDIIYYNSKEYAIWDVALNQIKKNKENKINIFDIGASHGSFSEFFNRKIKCNLFLFEPNRANINILEQKFKNESNIYIFNTLVTDDVDEKLFYEYDNSEVSSIYKVNKNSEWAKKHNFNLRNKYNVSSINLDTFVKDNKFLEIDLVKIDVQGAEFDILNGSKKTLEDKIVNNFLIEITVGDKDNNSPYDISQNLSDIISFMNQYNYKIFSIFDNNYNKDMSLQQTEILFKKT